MAKPKTSTSTKVQLSDRQLEVLSMITNPEARAELRGKFEAKVIAREAKNAEYLSGLKSQQLEYGLTESGAVYLKGTGTRWGFVVFSPERARQFANEIQKFLAVVAELPEQD